MLPVFCRFLKRRTSRIAPMKTAKPNAPMPTPTPMPILAPEDSPLDSLLVGSGVEEDVDVGTIVIVGVDVGAAVASWRDWRAALYATVSSMSLYARHVVISETL